MSQRYRVFLNDRLIQISKDINITDYQQNIRIIPYQGNKEMELEYERFKLDFDFKKLIFHSRNQFKEAFDSFGSLFRKVKAAGGIVRNTNGEFLFIFRHGLWDLPKGKLEKNEMPEQGALREVSEETGLTNLIINKPLPATFHIYPDRSGIEVLKETYWYEMMHQGIAMPVPQVEEDITEVKWFSPDQVQGILTNTYASLRELVEGYLEGD